MPEQSPEAILREFRDKLAISVVSKGFDAIDQLAERGKDELKRALIRGIAGQKKSGYRPASQKACK